MTRSLTLLLIGALSLILALAVRAQDEHDHRDHDENAHETEHPADEHEEGEHAADEHAGDDPDEHGFVRLSAAELEEFGVDVVAAGPGVIETTLDLPGEVRPNDDRLAHIVPRYSGIVTEVLAHIGDYVEKGDVLARIESDESLAPFDVKTLLSGTVIGKHITLGEAASRERDAFVIADLSTVWVDITVYQRDLAQVRAGQQAQVYVGHDVAQGTSSISYVSPIVDERTRTATARIVLPNGSKTWRPGMFVTARVLIERMDVPVAVPLTAIQTIAEESVVFLETDEGFKPQPVTLGRSGQTHVEIISGLVAGDRYVSAGGFTLKAELAKDAFGDGHGH